jgi:hypothetical protein
LAPWWTFLKLIQLQIFTKTLNCMKTLIFHVNIKYSARIENGDMILNWVIRTNFSLNTQDENLQIAQLTFISLIKTSKKHMNSISNCRRRNQGIVSKLKSINNRKIEFPLNQTSIYCNNMLLHKLHPLGKHYHFLWSICGCFKHSKHC